MSSIIFVRIRFRKKHMALKSRSVKGTNLGKLSVGTEGDFTYSAEEI